jgi:type IV pilus assembly protein PilW
MRRFAAAQRTPLVWVYSCRGVTLIELMVSLVIGALLIAGAVTVYMHSRNTYRVTETAARLQEVARYALDTIEPDVRLAGFWGLTNRADFVENRGAAPETEQAVAATVTDDCGNNWIVDVAQFIDGRDATTTGGSGYDLACSATSAADWSDVLIVRRASSDVRALTAGRAQIQTNRMRGVIFADGVLPAGFSAAPSSETRDLVVHAYYVSNSGVGANGLPQYQLRRQTLVGGGPAIDDIEIIPGVEDLQVQFGVDRNGDGNADQYVNPGSVPAAARITTARVWLRVVAEDAEVGFTDNTDYSYANTNPGAPGDNRRRVLISKTIQIRNSRA